MIRCATAPCLARVAVGDTVTAADWGVFVRADAAMFFSVWLVSYASGGTVRCLWLFFAVCFGGTLNGGT